MSDTVLITVDGVRHRVPAGRPLGEALEGVGVALPGFCRHPALTTAPDCGACAVRVDGALVSACSRRTAADLVVEVADAAARSRREETLRGLARRHPPECPTCPQAGACALQTAWVESGDRHLETSVVPAGREPARKVASGLLLDERLCIGCGLCVAFVDQVLGRPEDLVMEGDEAGPLVRTRPSLAEAEPYLGSLAELCPTGAFARETDRRALRAWNLVRGPSLCPGCATGCNVWFESDATGREPRFLARRNDEVNRAWICDEGRALAAGIDRDRLDRPRAHSVEVGWEGAMIVARGLLRRARREGEGRVAALAGYDATNEEVWFLRRMMRAVFGQDRIGVLPVRPDGEADDLLLDVDRHANRYGVLVVAGRSAAADLAAWLESADVLITLGVDPGAAFRPEELRRAAGAVRHRIALATHVDEGVLGATVALPTAIFAEKAGTWVNRQGRVQLLDPVRPRHSDARDDLEALQSLANALTGRATPAPRAEEVFADLARHHPRFAGLDREALRPEGRPLGRARADRGGRPS